MRISEIKLIGETLLTAGLFGALLVLTSTAIAHEADPYGSYQELPEKSSLGFTHKHQFIEVLGSEIIHGDDGDANESCFSVESQHFLYAGEFAPEVANNHWARSTKIRLPLSIGRCLY